VKVFTSSSSDHTEKEESAGVWLMLGFLISFFTDIYSVVGLSIKREIQL
jgi:hypothetical protein